MEYIYLNGKDEEKQRPELVIIRGVQGSGKTTLAKRISKLGYKHHENDQFFTDENGHYQFDFSKHQLAKDQTLKKTKKDLEKGLNVVVSNTFNTLKELDVYIDMAKKVGANVNVINTRLNYENVHNIPKEVIEKAKKTYENRDLDQKISSSRVNWIKGPENFVLTMYQSELKKGKRIPKLMINDSIDRLKLAHAYTNYLYSNSEPNTQYQETIIEDKNVVKEVLSMLSVARLDEAIESMKSGSIYAQNVLMPQEFFDVIKKDQYLKEKIKHVLVSYFVESPNARKEDEELSLEIYKKEYKLGIKEVDEPIKEKKNIAKPKFKM